MSVVDFHCVEHLHKRRIIMVDDLAVTQIQLRDLCHILIAEFKIPDIHVLFHAVLVYGLRDDSHPTLYIPAQRHLGSALSVFLTDLCQDRMSENPMISFGKRSPCLWLHTVFFHQGKGVFLLEKRMQLYLIDCRRHFHCLTQIRKPRRIEVTYADGLELSFFVRFLHGTVCADVISHGLMEQIQIQIIQPQLVK